MKEKEGVRKLRRVWRRYRKKEWLKGTGKREWMKKKVEYMKREDKKGKKEKWKGNEIGEWEKER